MNRRNFIRAVMQGVFATSAITLESPLRPYIRLARAALGKTVLIIYQRGGCDGLNAVVPYGDGLEYYRLRPTIGIAPPSSSGLALTPPSSLMDFTPALQLEDMNGGGYGDFFGLHPSLAALHAIYQNGDLAVLPTVQYPDASRSHFDGQLFQESAASSADRMNKEALDGWLNRHMATLAQPGALRALSFGSSVAHSLRGPVSVSSLDELERFSIGLPSEEEDALLGRLLTAYSEPPEPQSLVRELVHDTGGTLFRDMDVINNLDPGYTPDNGAQYPTGGFGNQLKRVAQIHKAGIGLEVAAVSIGGWDTHSDQGGGNPNGRQARRFQDFANGIGALYTDLGGFTPDGGEMNNVLVLTMTEFGRTAEQNGSFGTDHGNAASWFAVGGGLNGGVYLNGVNGTGWPGLAQSNLYRGRYLDWTIDYRDVMAEVLTRFMGNSNVGTVLRGHAYTPVGFL